MEQVYLLHVINPETGESARLGHAAHYAGYTSWDVEGRLAYHRAGKGSRLMAAIMDAGLDVVVARRWLGGTRTDERRLKNRGSLCRSCPVCRGDARIYRHWYSGKWHVRMLPGRRARYGPA